MTFVYLADTQSVELYALRLITLDLNWNLAGQASDWPTVVTQLPPSRSDILVVDWNLLPTAPSVAINRLRMACLTPLVVVLISQMDFRQQAAFSVGADVFINRNDMAENVVPRFRAIPHAVS